MDNRHYNQCARDVAAMMAALTAKWHRSPHALASCLTDSLVTLVATASQTPEKHLAQIVERINNSDYKSIKTEYFGVTLGVKDEVMDDGRSDEPRGDSATSQEGESPQCPTGLSPGAGQSKAET